MAQGTCSIEGCGNPVNCRGWCRKHYTRWQRHGDPLVAQTRLPWPENLLQRMEPQPNGCIYYTGGTNGEGYGAIDINGTSRGAHLAAYGHFVGPIPAGHTIDHTCHNEDPLCNLGVDCPHRRCVNPEHLEPVTTRENVLRGKGASAVNARKTHCPQGHPYDEENAWVDAAGSRHCRTCWKGRITSNRLAGVSSRRDG